MQQYVIRIMLSKFAEQLQSNTIPKDLFVSVVVRQDTSGVFVRTPREYSAIVAAVQECYPTFA